MKLVLQSPGNCLGLVQLISQVHFILARRFQVFLHLTQLLLQAFLIAARLL
jgi:hypothetical protein